MGDTKINNHRIIAKTYGEERREMGSTYKICCRFQVCVSCSMLLHPICADEAASNIFEIR